MMNPDDYRALSGMGAGLWALASLGVILIQLIVWPKDSQMWAALLAVSTVFVLTGRLFVSLRFGIVMGTNEQGVMIFFVGGLLWLGFFFWSWQHNLGLYGRRFRDIMRKVRNVVNRREN